MGDILSSFVARGIKMVERQPAIRICAFLYILSVTALFIFGFALHFRVSAGMLEADEAEYLDISSDLLAGITGISARRTLAFPLLLAGIRSFTTNILVLQMVIAVIFALSSPLLFLTARKLTQSNAGPSLGAALFSFWPPALFYGTSVYSETLALPVFLGSLALLPIGSRIRSSSQDGRLLAVSSGLVLGLAAHVRPMYLLFLPVVAVILLFEEARFRAAAGRLFFVVIGFTIVVLPWSIYMTQRFGDVIILTANGGETLGGGLTPKLVGREVQYTMVHGDRRVWVGPGKWLSLSQNGYLSAEDLKKPYTEINHILQQRTLAWALANPSDAAWLEWCKLRYMWGADFESEEDWRQIVVGNLPILALLVLGSILFYLEPLARTRFVRLWIITLFVSGVALISWGSWRFRQPADAGLLGFVACTLLMRVSRRSGRLDDRPVDGPRRLGEDYAAGPVMITGAVSN